MNPVRAVLSAPVVQLVLTKAGRIACPCRRDDTRMLVERYRGLMFLRCPDCGRETQGFQAHEPTTKPQEQ